VWYFTRRMPLQIVEEVKNIYNWSYYYHFLNSATCWDRHCFKKLRKIVKARDTCKNFRLNVLIPPKYCLLCLSHLRFNGKEWSKEGNS
jgi:hypothetical protein